MSDEQDLTGLLEGAIRGVTRDFVIVDGIITDVDSTAYTCTVQVGGTTENSLFYNVPLKVLKGSRATFLERPAAGSDCLLGFRDGDRNRPQLVSIDKGDVLYIDTPNVIFHGGELGGMVKAKELQAQSEKDRDILLALLQIITGPPINEPGNGAPSAFQTALKGVLEGKEPGEWDNLENDTITQ